MKSEIFDLGAYRTLLSTEQTLAEYAEVFNRDVHPANVDNRRYCDPEWKLKNGGRADWYSGITSIADAQKLVAEGWKAGAERVNALRAQLAAQLPAPQSRRRRQRWSDDGDALDVDRALSGQWDVAYRNAQRVSVAGPQIIELGLLDAHSAAHQGSELFWPGAVALVLTDLLEEAGYSVRLLAVELLGDCNRRGCFSIQKVIVKEPEDPIRSDTLAAVLCHAGVYRTLGFCRALANPFDVTEGIGAPQRWENVDAIARDRGIWDASLIQLPTAYYERDALQACQNVLKRFNPEVL